MISRRGFLGAILAAGTAPAYVRYRSLMVPRAIEIAPDWTVPRAAGFANAWVDPASEGSIAIDMILPQSAPEFEIYIRGLLREMARSLGTPYEELARSPAKMQYAALQARLDGGW